MNDQFSNNEPDQEIARKLNQVAEQTHANAQFAAELEERLRTTRQHKTGWLTGSLKQISPVLRWGALMILLAAAFSLSIKMLVPTPPPATENTPEVPETVTLTPKIETISTGTSVSTGDGIYDWRGTKLTLAVPLPESPTQANVFILQPEQPATIESVRALADRFGMQGEIFEIELEPNASAAFSVVDGNRRLNVRSDRYFEYIPDIRLMNSENRFSLSNPNAEALIMDFLGSYNFSFPYTVEPSELYQGYYVQALTPDGFPIHHEFFGQDGLLFHLNDTQIVYVSASLPTYNQVGTYRIKSAQEAFQQLIAATDLNGMIEGVHSSEKPPQVWKRDYPVNETVTIYGFMNVNPSADGAQSLISIDHFPATGNLAGAENLEKLTLVKATGQFTVEGENKVFNVETWEIYRSDDHGFLGKNAFPGTLQKQGEDVVVVSEKGTFILPDVPAGVPLPLENAYVYGVVLGDTFEWEGIEYRENSDNRGGGGGSSGNGFYKLNLSGPPVAFPGSGNYVVKDGDTCGSITAQFGISIRSLIAQNQLSENCLISVGQTLIIPSPSVPSNSNQGSIEYVIQEGDTLAAIAEAHGLSPEDIRKANPWLIEENVLTPGKVLVIPVSATQTAITEYVVQENDTLAYIALKFGITVEELKQANNITDDIFFVDQVLFIPGQQKENPYIGRRFEKQRGMLVITIIKQLDGSLRNEFAFIMKNEDGSTFNAVLENVSLEALRDYQNLPLDVWGTVGRVDQDGNPVINVERYEVPFPDLHIQVLQGKQRLTELDGKQVLLFTTTDGTTYAQMSAYYTSPDTLTLLGVEGDEVLLESLAIPGETFGGYPALYIFRGEILGSNPENDQPLEIEITADQPYVVEEYIPPELFAGPTATIENVELVYYVPDSRYRSFAEGSNAEYIQPAWRFYGHYSDGKEFEILIQALKQEYLLPELAPFTRPG